MANYSADQIKRIGSLLNPEELLALSIILGYKPEYRQRESDLLHFQYKNYISSLSKNGVLTPSGKRHNQTYDFFHVQLPDQLGSQLHQVIPKLEKLGLKLKESKINENKLRQMIRDMIDTEIEEDAFGRHRYRRLKSNDEIENDEIEETSTTGGVAGYQTPRAFVGTKGKELKKNWLSRVNKSIGYQTVGDEEDADELGTNEKKKSNLLWKNKIAESTTMGDLQGSGIKEDKSTNYYVAVVHDDNIVQVLKKFSDYDEANNFADKHEKEYHDEYVKKNYDVVVQGRNNESVMKEAFAISNAEFAKRLKDAGYSVLDVDLANNKKYIFTFTFSKKPDAEKYFKFLTHFMSNDDIAKSHIDQVGNAFKLITKTVVPPPQSPYEFQFNEEVGQDVKDEVMALLKQYNGKEIPDDKVHAIADKHKVSPHDLESFIYSLASAHVNENRHGQYQIYRDDPSLNTQQKIGESIKRIRRNLKELNREVALNVRLKTESGINSDAYWKRTRKDLMKIAEHLYYLQEKIKRF